ncbi:MULTISPECIES: FAD/NAD(P)-dependent oxidoreductase [Ochrobactrum]|uniref:FAD-dependent oxidoreductase n=1 Tax=Ochrobactrum soli TaxID=2448455 RepID=A0A849KR79_9HYPH|nr:NAD(P)/FAD-dependent oxidoreductase [[Ochrobactrum] soli]MBM7331064.1 FAD-dependent oxidoreductase [Agrobacterium sp. S2]NNU61089.1 FAD-dependent oxidoreductase [[Ochrobactrum] soli]RLL63999.1 FAD/NAD(P)-binding oxidoreductase [[Ochrobactrum] soli]
MSAVASPLLAPVIVGAGPAGIRAAETLVKAGLRPVVLDEGMRSGGQIYRRPPIDDGRSYRSRYGSEAPKAEALHTTFDTLRGSIDYHPETLVWNISRNDGDHLDLLTDGVHGQLPYSHLILATGATDRVLPFKGWTKPGVYTLGASQTALKAQGCTVGERVVFMGSGPLLYLVAWQYHHAGAKVAAVLDTARFAAKFHLAHLALYAPRIVALGAYYGLRLKLAGVPIHYDVRPDCVLGDDHVEGLRYRTGKSEHEVACDALAYGFALRPETQLADLAGCDFRFEDRDRAWLPMTDKLGRTSRIGVYVAGDGAGIAGADAAEIRGQLAAIALLRDLGLPFDNGTEQRLIRKRDGIYRERLIVEKAFPFPLDWFQTVAGDVTLCRCEEISLAEARDVIGAGNTQEINRLKALSRVGMGRCQGRMCSAAAAELLASMRDKSPADGGRIRAQAPVKPIPLGFGAAAREDVAS